MEDSMQSNYTKNKKYLLDKQITYNSITNPLAVFSTVSTSVSRKDVFSLFLVTFSFLASSVLSWLVCRLKMLLQPSSIS